MGFLEGVLRMGITRDLGGILRIMKAIYINYRMLRKQNQGEKLIHNVLIYKPS